MPDLEALSLEFTDFILPILGIIISITLGIFLHNLAKTIAASFAFRSLGYRVGEEVIFNGQNAVIIQIGLLYSSFMILNGDQNNSYIRQRIVPSQRLEWQEIEKISLRIKNLESSKENHK